MSDKTWGNASQGQGSPHSTEDHYVGGGPGGQGEEVQGGPLQVGGGPHESAFMLELSNKSLETASFGIFLQHSITHYYLRGLVEQVWEVQGGCLLGDGGPHESNKILVLSSETLKTH